jgi:hypothetical protein
MDNGAAAAVAVRVVIQAMPKRVHVERVLSAQQISKSMAALCRTIRFEDRLTHIRLAADFTYSHQAGIRVDADDENILGAIGDLIDLRQP